MEKGANGTIAYSGKVDVTVKKGKKTVYKKTFHNAGNDPLYRFLSLCIVDNDYDSRLAPRYVRLFSFGSEVSPSVVDYPIATTVISSANSKRASTAVLYSTGEVIDYGTAAKPAAYLHFVIPCSSLVANDGTSKAVVHQVGLYSANDATDNIDDYSAMVNFLSADGTAWEGMEISTINGDYTVFLDWTMSFEAA